MSPRQFDVFPNPDPESAEGYPYFVVLQHDVLTRLNTRVVAPLIPPKSLPFFERLMPEVNVKRSRYVIDMTNVGVIPVLALNEAIANLEKYRYQIVGAMDLVFSGIGS